MSAQVGLNRIYKESHQSVDLVSMFSPVTKWADVVLTPGAVPEMVRKAFELAQTERPGAVYLPVPEDVEAMGVFPDDHPHALGAVGFMRHPSASTTSDRPAAGRNKIRTAKSPGLRRTPQGDEPGGSEDGQRLETRLKLAACRTHR